MHKTEGLVKYQVVFLKPIIMQYNLMAVISTIPLHTFPWKKCVPIILNIMGYHNGNVCYIVVISAKVMYYPVSAALKKVVVEKYKCERLIHPLD